MATSRRNFVQAAGLGAFTFQLGGTAALLTPQQAFAQGADFQVFDAIEVSLLEAIGEALLPGAREAGIAHFVDQQLTLEPNDALLMAKYFNVEPPYTNFYRACFVAIDTFSKQEFGKVFRKLDTDQAAELITTMAFGEPKTWQGPPGLIAYLSLRADAVDVVYGTQEGFAELKVPYMPHIVPPAPW